ncbi:MAG: helix-turn-helix transcriptional regulator [Eubacteriales bacterium]|nr:helix-turn-helix transcriptional regulator [Eubacteriales bacterium]
MSVGNRLKEWRKQNNLKMTEIKEKTGISTGGISDYENDKKLIGSKTLICLAENYNIDIHYILTGVRREGEKLSENEKELLEQFNQMTEREQIKMIGVLEEKVKEQENKLEKSSEYKTG